MCKIVAFGDSWTAGHGVETDSTYKEDSNPPKFIENLRNQNSWVRWCAEKMGIGYVNMGECGFGNEYIYKSVKENLKFINNDDIIIIVFSYPHRYEKYNKYTSKELLEKFDKLLYGHKKFYFNGFYPFIEDVDFNFPKHYINPLGTLSYQLQVEELVNKKSVWEYDSKSIWNDEKNYHEGDYHPNLNGYKILGEFIYNSILKK